MRKFLFITSLLITGLTINAVADINIDDSACKDYKLSKQKAESAKNRNKFLDVKNPNSNQAPAYLEDEAKQLEKKCNLEIAKAQSEKSDKIMAQPKKDSIK